MVCNNEFDWLLPGVNFSRASILNVRSPVELEFNIYKGEKINSKWGICRGENSNSEWCIYKGETSDSKKGSNPFGGSCIRIENLDI